MAIKQINISMNPKVLRLMDQRRKLENRTRSNMIDYCVRRVLGLAPDPSELAEIERRGPFKQSSVLSEPQS